MACDDDSSICPGDYMCLLWIDRTVLAAESAESECSVIHRGLRRELTTFYYFLSDDERQ